ncbi:MAG: gamma-glutamyl-gamma-aminobutyrate hydrolase family protein, partial [Syntrophomonas sp.]
MRSVIGISASYCNDDKNYYLKEAYVLSVQKAGGIAVILPPLKEMVLIDEYIRCCDAFLFSGGGDIDPVFWGELPEPGLGEIEPLRDSFELALAARVLQLGIPVLGICRGCQLLNVAAGGSLLQDINSSMDHYQNAPRDYPFHVILIEEDSRLSGILESCSIKVNSFHHQAVKRTGTGMKAVAWAPDGTIEAIEGENGFILGVQWHPECLIDEYSKRLF